MPSIPPPVPARNRRREAHRQDLSACHTEEDEVVGPLVRPTRCMTPNQGSAHREGRAGTAGHGDTVAEGSVRHPRSNVPVREVEQTHIAVCQQSRNRRHERRTALRSSRGQRFGRCTGRCDQRGPAVMQGQSLVADFPAARHGGSVRSGKPSATTSPRPRRPCWASASVTTVMHSAARGKLVRGP